MTSSEQTTPVAPRSYHTLSSAPSRATLSAQPSSSVQSSPGGHRTTSNALITVEQAISQAGGSVQTALENLVNERNSLQNQNELLWKHVAKVKSTTADLKKDIERIRGERDRAVAQLEGRPDDRRSRPTERSVGSGSDPYGSPVNQRDSARSVALNGSASTPSLPSTRSTNPSSTVEPLRPASRMPLSRSETDPPPSSSNNPTIGPRREKTTDGTVGPSTAIIPPTPTKSRQNSVPDASDSSSSPTRPSPASSRGELRTPSAERELSTPPHPISLPTSAPIPGETSPLTPRRVSKHSSLSPTTPKPNPTMAGTPSTPSPTGASLSPDAMGGRRHMATRESRISLPAEASQYISNMVDSPQPSPHPGAPNAGFPSTSPASASPSTPINGRQRLAPPFEPVQEETVIASDPAAAKDIDDEFMNAEDAESIDEGPPRPSTSSSRSGRRPSPNPEPGSTSADYETSASSQRGGMSDSVSSLPQDSKLPVVPPLDVVTQPTASPQRSNQALPSVAPERPPLFPSFSSSSSLPSFVTDAPDVPPPYPPSLQNGASGSTAEPQPSQAAPQRFEYKSARLTSDDLPHTTVYVVGSTIRPNERGKEVLSFIIALECKGKDPWKVEKLYSDVLTLDVRVRGGVGKTAGKKIAPLPDNKLFKDNAPAKVDQRKAALEVYFQSLVDAPFKKKDDVCMFFSTGLVREDNKPVHHIGYKEGYLTKRSKNFGGFLRWKTRYFVLQSPVLEYYESRGGPLLGHIQIANAQIGRQQKPSSSADDENAFRHAFLIIEDKKGPGGAPIRHVLCSDSDAERDSWVDVLVRYVASSSPGDAGYGASTSSAGVSHHAARSSSSSSVQSPIDGPQGRPRRGVSKDDIIASHSSLDGGASSDTASANAQYNGSMARQLLDRQLGSSVPASSSMPTHLETGAQRANSELGHYPDLVNGQDARSSTSSIPAPRQQRASYHPTLSTVRSAMDSAESSPASEHPPHQQAQVQKVAAEAAAAAAANKSSKVTISGPIDGQRIPDGFRFGAKDKGGSGSLSEAPSSNDRERKAKSGRFWGFSAKAGGTSASTQPVMAPRAVFGVSIPDSLAVAQISNLPAIVFRCIEYLEKKKAAEEEGIYRLSGSSAVIKSVRDRFNGEGDVNLLASDEYWDPHAIAGLLKSYFRELPSSILTHDLHFRFLKVIDLADVEERVSELGSLISQLPLSNYCLLRALCAHLILIVQNANVNKMTMRNVGIVFSPTLGIPAGVFSLMLGEFRRVFQIEGDFVETGLAEPPAAPAADEIAPSARENLAPIHPSKRNSHSYAEASTDLALGLTGRSLATPEEDSDDVDDIPLAEESGTETDAASSIAGADALGSPPDTPGPSTYISSTSERPSVDVSRPSMESLRQGRNTAAMVAASRGLQIQPDQHRPRLNGSSVPSPGLPSSPRAHLSPRANARGPGSSTSATYPADVQNSSDPSSGTASNAPVPPSYI